MTERSQLLHINPFTMCGWRVEPTSQGFRLRGGGAVITVGTLEEAVHKAQGMPVMEVRAK